MRLITLIQFVLAHPLNRGHRFGAMARLLRWQFLTRVSHDFSFVVPFTDQTVLRMGRGMTGATGNLYCGLHEFTEMAFVLHLLRSEDHFADIGANIGSYTVLASGHVGARSTAIEPIPGTFEALRINVALNGIQDIVQLHNLGVGSEDSTIRFSTGLGTTNHALAPGESKENSVGVEVRKMDDIFSDDPPVCIKIDVEGYETPAIEGALKLLRSADVKAVLMECGEGRRYGFDDAALHDRMIGLEFQPHSYEPFSRVLTPLENTSCSSGNVLYLRDLKWVQGRLSSAGAIGLPWRAISRRR